MQKPLTCMVDNDQEADEWINLLRSRAGVPPLRAAKVTYVSLQAIAAAVNLRSGDKEGGTALHMLAQSRSRRLREGLTSDDPAQVMGMLEAAAWLLECGAQLEATDGSGATPLQVAVANGNEPLIVLLKQRGARLGGLDSASQAILAAAEQRLSKGDAFEADFSSATSPVQWTRLGPPAKLKGFSYLSAHFFRHALPR